MKNGVRNTLNYLVMTHGGSWEVIRTDDGSDPYYCSMKARCVVADYTEIRTRRLDLREDSRMTRFMLRFSSAKQLQFLRQHIVKMAEVLTRDKVLRILARKRFWLKERT